MASRNRTHVAIDPDYSYCWVFVVPSTATTSEEHVSEITSVASKVLDACDSFVRPNALQYYIRKFSNGSHRYFADDGVEPLETVENSIATEDGVTSATFQQSFEVDHDGPVRVLKIGFDRSEVRISLEGGDRWLDRSQLCVPYRAGEPVDREPIRDPLSVTIDHATNVDHPEFDTGYVNYVWVCPQSDLWFEDSDIGEVNRTYLTAFLERVYDAVEPGAVVRESDRFPVEELENIF